VREDRVIQSGKAVAEAIKARREAVGLSKNALAQKAGISVQSVSFIESAVNSPSISTFLRICAALEVSPDNLLRDALGNIG
jgi:transcriptional regulator with XRE-family HTH domain